MTTKELGPDLNDPHVILDRMASIVDNDMLVRNTYIESLVTRHDLAEAGAICGGRRACAIGALWIAGGLSPSGPSAFLTAPAPDSYVGDTYWVFSDALRDHYLSDKPGLAAAHAALNEAALAYVDENGTSLPISSSYASAIEELFEEGYDRETGKLIDPRELLGVIDVAHAILRES